jgi:hypothetical protein
VSLSALILTGLGFGWLGLALASLGTLTYARLVCGDTINEDFLKTVFDVGGKRVGGGEKEKDNTDDVILRIDEYDVDLRNAYLSILLRRSQLEALLRDGPSVLQATMPQGSTICDELMRHARSLIRRGQRLRSYLRLIQLSDLSERACEAVLLKEATSDAVAERTYQQIVAAQQAHMETHIEVQGLYDRVLAQLALIETTLASVSAKIVKITATDDEESTSTAILVNEQLEVLISDVGIVETSLDDLFFEQPGVALAH